MAAAGLRRGAQALGPQGPVRQDAWVAFMNPFPLFPLELDRVPPGLILALAQEGVPACPRGERPEGRFVLFDGRKGPQRPLAAWQVPLDIEPIRRGFQADPFDALLDEQVVEASWEVTGLHLSERIARTDRRRMRRRIMDRLREQIEQAGGIWINIAPYPFPYRSAVNLRIDHDCYQQEDFRSLMAAVEDRRDATSHHLSGMACEQCPDILRRMHGFDVGVRGYRPHIYRSEQENYENLARGMELLHHGGLTPSGASAPGGHFTRAWAGAVERLALGHSSEIRMSYDDWPFFPPGSSVLQIPAHPVSLRLFLANVTGEGVRRAAAAQQAVHAAVDYFRQSARAKYHSGEPVFFSGCSAGCLGRYPQVVRAVFDTADSFAAVWPTTLAGFADWWRARAMIRLKVETQGDQFAILADGVTRRWPVAIEYWRGARVARIPLAGKTTRFSPGAVAYENRTRRPTVQPMRIDGPHGLRHHMRRLLETQPAGTPEETNDNTLRRWVARTLRSLGA